MRRIYLSGPITGCLDGNRAAFAAHAAQLRAEGWDVVNPHDLEPAVPGEWVSHMRTDLAALLTCEAIALLPGWAESRGACLELRVAIELEYQVLEDA